MALSNPQIVTDILGKITTGAVVGLAEFYSVFRSKRQSSPTSTGMSPLKGFLVPKSFDPPGYDETRMYKFQFNPDQIAVQKESIRANRQYTGLSYVDWIWTNGGPKVITFSLFLDATAGSQTGYFVPGNPRDQRIFDTLAQTKQRGVMQDLELLESFINPEVPTTGASTNGIDTQGNIVNPDSFTNPADALTGGQVIIPRFNSGGVTTPNQFYAPPTIIFVYGQFYLEGHIMECPYSITLFDRDLVARRAEVNIMFAVHEQVEVVPIPALASKSMGQPNNTNSYQLSLS